MLKLDELFDDLEEELAATSEGEAPALSPGSGHTAGGSTDNVQKGREMREKVQTEYNKKCTSHKNARRCTVKPANTKDTIKIALRGMKKDVRVPYSLRLTKLVAKITERITSDQLPRCAQSDVWMVVLRAKDGAMDTHGIFLGDMLLWKVWEAAIQPGDVVHVIAPLPPDWHLNEDIEAPGLIFYMNYQTQMRAEDLDVLETMQENNQFTAKVNEIDDLLNKEGAKEDEHVDAEEASVDTVVHDDAEEASVDTAEHVDAEEAAVDAVDALDDLFQVEEEAMDALNDLF